MHIYWDGSITYKYALVCSAMLMKWRLLWSVACSLGTEAIQQWNDEPEMMSACFPFIHQFYLQTDHIASVPSPIVMQRSPHGAYYANNEGVKWFIISNKIINRGVTWIYSYIVSVSQCPDRLRRHAISKPDLKRSICVCVIVKAI